MRKWTSFTDCPTRSYTYRVKGTDTMAITPAEIEDILEQLARTPLRIAAWSSIYDEGRMYLKPQEEAWSVNDVLAHLRACAEVWGKSIRIMIAQDHPTLRYVSPRTWIRKTNLSQQEFPNALKAFTEQRGELMSFLKTLRIEDWSRGATFTGTTRGREPTVFSFAQRIAQHESEHCIQIDALLQTMQN